MIILKSTRFHQASFSKSLAVFVLLLFALQVAPPPEPYSCYTPGQILWNLNNRYRAPGDANQPWMYASPDLQDDALGMHIWCGMIYEAFNFIQQNPSRMGMTGVSKPTRSLKVISAPC